jgi:hypothetical protein
MNIPYMYGGLQYYDPNSRHFEYRINRYPTSYALVVTPSLLELGTVLSWAFAFRVSPLAHV